jgi:hypothetical protein
MTPSERGTAPPTPAAASGSLRVSGRRGWDQHPGVRTGARLGPGEHAADVVCGIAGSWTCMIVVAVVVAAGAAVAFRHDNTPGGVAHVGAGVAVLALMEVSLVLVAARRAERIAVELALYHLDQARRATAIAEDLRSEMQRLHADVVRIAAYTEKAGQPARHP